MKLKKMVLPTLGITTLLNLNFSELYAIAPRTVYNKVNVVMSSIMKFTIPILIIDYIIFVIVYPKKSKKDEGTIMKTLCILLAIDILAVIALYFGANLVLEAGSTYTSIPRSPIYLVD